MRAAILTSARAVLLVGPTALAFFSGGFFDGPRLVAGIAAWALVAVAAAAGERPLLPPAAAARAAIAGLAALCAWAALSLLWAPVAGDAYDDAQRAVVYLGTLVAAAALLQPRPAARALEPALAGGAVAVVAYGLSERLVPGAVELSRSVSAAGRLDQPLTYWNAMGILAAMGLLLCARLAGDGGRRPALRAAAAAGAAPLGMGLYLSFSRGALFACAAGVAVLLVAAPARAQLRGAAIAAGAAALAALASSPFRGVTALEGGLGRREAEGAAALGALAAIALAAAWAQWRIAGAERRGTLRGGGLRLPRGAPAIAAALVLVLLGTFVAVGATERTGAPSGATAARFGSLESNRYSYWRVAARAFADHPLRGTGASGFRTEWLRERPFAESVHDAHSLYLETAAELGLVGLALLAAVFAAVAAAARQAHRRDPVLAAGAVALLVAWAVHAGIDWDWEMPAVTLPAVLAAGMLLASLARPPRRDAPGPAPEAGYVPPPIPARLRSEARARGRLAVARACAGWGARYVLGLPATLAPARRTFEFQGRTYAYLVHRHNHTWLNERAVEVPIAKALADGRGRLLEVGHVLGHYSPCRHEVLDKYEIGPGVVNQDVLEFTPDRRYDAIVSVSTLEHVGWDEQPRDPERALAVVGHLRHLLAPGGLLVVTVPVGYHPVLDAAIREGRAGFDHVAALRWEGGLSWREVDPATVWDAPYDRLLYRATGLLVCTARAPAPA